MSSLGDSAFNALPSRIKSRIDDAFSSISARSRKSNDEVASGGFIVEEEDDAFLPLSLVPDALSLLDLPPNDAQILAVFKNAVEDDDDDEQMDNAENGLKVSRQRWRAVCAVLLEGEDEDEDEGDDGAEDEDVVMDDPIPSPPPRSTELPSASSSSRPRRSTASYRTSSAFEDVHKDSSSSGDSDDNFQADDVEEDEPPATFSGVSDSEDEYTGVADKHTPNAKGKGKATPKASAKDKAKAPNQTKGKGKAKAKDNESKAIPSTKSKSSSTGKGKGKAKLQEGDELSEDQVRVCADAFALFFPSSVTGTSESPSSHPTSSGPKLDPQQQKIMIRHLRAAANTVGEKIKAEEFVEMLEYFSPTDKAIGFNDFTKIMVATGLI